MPAVSAPADRRFRRARVKPGRKRSATLGHGWIAARIVIVFGLMAYGGWRGTALMLGAPVLQISRVTVRDNDRLSTGEVLALVSGLQRRNILTVRLDEWRKRLLSSPWVEDATLRRQLPSTIEVRVRERRPMGIGRVVNGLYLVDRRGVIVDEYGPNYADLDLPIIDGLASVPHEGSPAVDESHARLAARLIAALESRPDLAARVSQIDVSDRRDAVVLLEGDTAMLRLGDEDFVARLQEYLDLAPALRERIAEIDYVDMRFENRLYVRPIAKRSGRSSDRPKE
jgi:cell division septal protein FtsQ